MGRSGGHNKTAAASPAQQRAQAAITAAMSSSSSGADAPTLTVRSARSVATLWAGYGTISEVSTDAEDEDSGADGQQLLIVKEVAPPAGSGVSHLRKLRSYQIEAAFYQRVAPHLPPTAACHVPRCLGVHNTLDADSADGSGGMQLVMTDLRQRFPCSASNMDERHTKAALSWLAAFHAACWGADARQLGLWEAGCYWHLQTRLEEYEDIGREWKALKSAAHELDRRLADTRWRTLCHGDFKAANLLFSDIAGGSAAPLECAAYDFQYVGGGSGMKDVVYLLASAVQGRLLQQPAGEEALLRHYHHQLTEGLRAAAAGSGLASGVGFPEAAAEAAEQYTYEEMYGDYQLAMLDYVRFMAGWGWWGNTSWASARARTFLQDLGLAG